MDDGNLSYAQTPMVEPYLYCTVPDRLQQHATDTPEKAAFIIHSVTGTREIITCRDIYADSVTFAKGLLCIGINKGDTVGIAYPNGREWLVSTFGVQMAGGVPLHMEYKYKDGRDIIPVLQNTGNCKAILMDRGNDEANTTFIDNIISGFKMDNGKIEVNSNCLPTLKFIIMNNQKNKGCMPFSEVFHCGEKSKIDTNLPDIDPDDLAAFLLTSGSTGLPKLVPKTHFQLLQIGQYFMSCFGIQSSDIFFNDRLFNWLAGYPTAFLVSGATHITSSDQFTLSSVKDICDFAIRTIKRENCTVTLLLPAFILEIVKRQETDFHQRTIFTGGVPVPRECADVVGRFSEEFINGYGSSEISAVSMKKVQRSSEYSSYCVGRPIPGVEMKIVDSKGKTVQQNQTGALLVRHPVAFSGYHNNITKTNQVLSTTGWYKTDDSAYMDDNGDFFVTGRCSDVILLHGELIYPTNIEDEIRSHPSVAEVCVVPVSDPICFQKVCACIVLRKNASLTEDELKEFLFSSKTNGVPFKDQYKIFLFFEMLPKTAVGKIYRKGVREAAEKRVNEQ